MGDGSWKLRLRSMRVSSTPCGSLMKSSPRQLNLLPCGNSCLMSALNGTAIDRVGCDMMIIVYRILKPIQPVAQLAHHRAMDIVDDERPPHGVVDLLKGSRLTERRLLAGRLRLDREEPSTIAPKAVDGCLSEPRWHRPMSVEAVIFSEDLPDLGLHESFRCPTH